MTTRTVVAHGPDPGRGGLPSQDTLPEKGSNGNATVTDPSSFACGHLLEKYAGTTTFTLRSLDGALLREVELKSGAYEWVEDYIYRDGQLLASQHRTEGHQHYHLDHLGTTRMLTNRCGERVKRYELFPYGDTISAPPNDTETRRFTGHQRDLGSPTNTTDDLEYMHARYYGVKMGRLLSVDPGGGRARTPMQWNRYAYVSGNPMRRVDPDGAEEAEVAIPIWQRETIRDYYNQAEPGLGDVLAEQHDRSMRAGAAGALAVFGAAAAAVFAPEIYTWFLTPRGQQTVANTIEALNPNPGSIAPSVGVTIPGPRNSPFGKLDYLLGLVPGNVASAGKGQFFAGVLGFSQKTLESALQSHLLSNLEKAVLDGSKVRVVAPMVGANGVKANVLSVWQVVEVNGQRFYQLITAQPGPH